MDPSITPDFWTRVAEFGVLGFLLVLVLVAVAYLAYHLGGKLVAATADSLDRQAQAADRASQAVAAMSTSMVGVEQLQQEHGKKLDAVVDTQTHQTRALRHIVAAATELSDTTNTRAIEALADARRALEA